MELTIANETSMQVTLTWPAVPDCSGYIFYVDGKKISNTTDGTKTSISITKPDAGPHTYGVQPLAALGPMATIVVPAPLSLTIVSSIKDGAVLSAPTPWVITSAKPLLQVRFYIDGNSEWIENYEPWVFNGDPGGVLDPATLSPGTHVLKAVATDSKGATGTAVSNITVKAVTPTPTPTPTPQPTGTTGVRFCMYAQSQADKYTLSPAPTQTQKNWMIEHWDRAIIYVDQIAQWHPGGWGYIDMMAIYTNSLTAAQHPEWILKNASGTKLTFFSSIQYAADIGNPAYRQYKVDQVKALVAKGYRGLHADDVNLDRVVVPTAINPRTGQVYTFNDWRRDFAQLMVEIRQACPHPFEIVHNALWWEDLANADVVKEIQASDFFELERGFNDPNYTPAKIEQVWAFVDRLHAWGVSANHLSEASGQQAATFNLGCALLCTNGNDYVFGDGWRPDAWNAMYDVAKTLVPKGDRYKTGTNTRARDFTRKGATVTVRADLQNKTATIPGV